MRLKERKHRVPFVGAVFFFVEEFVAGVVEQGERYVRHARFLRVEAVEFFYAFAHVAHGIVLARHEQHGQVFFQPGDVAFRVETFQPLEKIAVESVAARERAVRVRMVGGVVFRVGGEPFSVREHFGVCAE